MPCVSRKLLKYAVLNAVNVSIVMTTAADLLKGMYHIDVHNISIGRYSLAFPQARCLKLYVWTVRTVTFLAKLFSCADSGMVVSCGMVWSLLIPLQFAFLIGLPYNVAECSYLEALLSMSQGHVNPRDYQRVMDAQWQLTQQTYGLYRPSRDGFLQIFRAVTSYIGPGNPAILSVPVSALDSPDFILNLIEQSWTDLRIPGAVVPWQLFPIDSTRAQSSQRALAYPSYIMVTHDDFASFEQRPHGLMEVIIPGDSWLFGTVLPWRVNWSILREFIAPWCPLGLAMDRIEFLLSGTLLTEQIVECWHGFYARVILTYRGSPPPMLLPFRQIWAPLPHLQHSILGDQVYRHVVYVPGGTSLLFSSLFEAFGRETQWCNWLPGVVQESALLLRPCALRCARVHDAIRVEMPICPCDTIHFALIPALSPPHFPMVIVVKVSFPPIVQVGAVFCSDHISRFGLLLQLGFADQCSFDGDEPCVCYKNGMPISDHPVSVNHADFVSCYKGRSYAIDDEDAVIISDSETTLTGPPPLAEQCTNCNELGPHLGEGAGSLASSGPAL